jgi:PAS domain S-box-containing protein
MEGAMYVARARVLRARLDSDGAADDDVSAEGLRARVDELLWAFDRADAERRRYREIVEAAAEALVVTDPSGVVRDANPAAAALLAADRQWLQGKPLAMLVDPPSAARVTEALSELRTAARVAITARLRRRDDVLVAAVIGARRIEQGRSVLLSVQEVPPARDASDVEGRVRVAELERALRDKEEILARERSMRQRLERESRARDRLLGALSEDLRGPINGVLGWIQLLEREVLPKAARDQALAAIDRSTRAQLAIVDELVEMSALATDKARLEIGDVDVATLVRRLAEGFLPSAVERQLVIACETEAASGTSVFGDRARLERVVSNLVSNAIKFTGPGGRVTVSVTAADRHAVIRVSDTGRGIPPSALPRVFEAFRHDEAAEERAGGLGLGLYVARQIVELHGGTIEVESEGEGRGATVTVRLPARGADRGAESGASMSTPAPRLAPASWVGEGSPVEARARYDLDDMRVLVFADDDDARDLLRELLTRHGATVAIARTAGEAAALVEPFVPDVVVSDVGGREDECAEIVRSLRRLAPEIPAVALSSFDVSTDAARAVDAGFDRHMSKPFDPVRLLETLRELVPSWSAEG